MPIVEFKNRAARIDSGLPELGRIYKGAARQSPNQKQIPPDLTYFRFEGNDLPTISGDEIKAAWHTVYGSEPDILRGVQFAADALPLVFDSWLETWGRAQNNAPQLNLRCDGESVHFRRTGQNVSREFSACTHQCECKPIGRLRIYLPALCAHLGVLGTVTLITHAGTDIDNISNTLGFVLTTAGRLRNISFILAREMTSLMTPAGLPVQKSIVRLDLDTASAQAFALEAGDVLALPAGTTVPAAPALPPPVVVEKSLPDENNPFASRKPDTRLKKNDDDKERAEFICEPVVWVMKSPKTNKPYYSLMIAESGNQYVFTWERQPFRGQGWNVDAWAHDPEDEQCATAIHLDRYPKVVVERKDKNDRWTIVHVGAYELADQTEELA